MKTKLTQLIMFSFIVLSLLAFVSITVEFPKQLTRSFGISAVYAQKSMKPKKPKKPKQPKEPKLPRNPWPDPISIPEPSTLVLVGTGLAAGAGIYKIMKYRRRNKKK